jgi:hypothetical protein
MIDFDRISSNILFLLSFQKLARPLHCIVCPEQRRSGPVKPDLRSNKMTAYFSNIAFAATIIGFAAMFASFTSII